MFGEGMNEDWDISRGGKETIGKCSHHQRDVLEADTT